MTYLVDADHLIGELLVRFLSDDVTVAAERDVDSIINQLPLVIYTVGAGRPTTNGPLRRAQWRPAAFQIIAGQTDELSAHEHASRVADELVEAVLEHFERARVEGVGAVARVGDDMSLPARSSSASVDGRDVVQFSAAFEFLVQPLL